MLITPIFSLNLSRSPSAIFFAVMPIVINAINGGVRFSVFFNMFYIGLIHIINKLIKIIPKTLNTSAPVPIVFAVVWLVYSIFYMIVTFLKMSAIQSMSFICGAFTYFLFSCPTPTTSTLAVKNSPFPTNYFISTITFKKPVTLSSITLWNWLNCSKSIIFFARYINQFSFVNSRWHKVSLSKDWGKYNTKLLTYSRG